MKPITQRLKVLRAGRGITQRDLALKAGMPMSRYWEIENGYRVPEDAELAKIARALKVDPDEIVSAVA